MKTSPLVSHVSLVFLICKLRWLDLVISRVLSDLAIYTFFKNSKAFELLNIFKDIFWRHNLVYINKVFPCRCGLFDSTQRRNLEPLYFSLKALVQDGVQPKKILRNAEHHQEVRLKQSSFLFRSKTGFYCAWIIASRKPQDIHSRTRDLFKEVTCQGSGWFSMWGLTLKIMRLFGLKL